MTKDEVKKYNYGEKLINYFLKKFNLKLKNNQKMLLIQIFNFTVVGFMATIIDFAFLYLFKEIFNLPVLISNTLSFTISLLYNYFASLTFVFEVTEENSKSNFLKFVFFSLIGLGINDVIMYILNECCSIYYLIAKVIATAIVMVFNFITRKMFLK